MSVSQTSIFFLILYYFCHSRQLPWSVSDQYFVVTSIVAKFDDFQKYDSFFVLQVCHLRQTFKPTAESCIFVHIILQEIEECKM